MYKKRKVWCVIVVCRKVFKNSAKLIALELVREIEQCELVGKYFNFLFFCLVVVYLLNITLIFIQI